MRSDFLVLPICAEITVEQSKHLVVILANKEGQQK